jgi:hypothetical protein
MSDPTIFATPQLLIIGFVWAISLTISTACCLARAGFLASLTLLYHFIANWLEIAIGSVEGSEPETA